MRFFCVVAKFKNEAHIIKEWCEHYLAEGADQIFMIDNGSSDDWEDEVKGFSNVHVVKDPMVWVPREKDPWAKHRAVQSIWGTLYNKHFLRKAKKYKWVLVVDLDEFLYARKGTLKRYLKNKKKRVRRIFVPWLMFGSSGYEEQPERVVNSFTRRRKKYEKQGKYFVRGSCLKSIRCHRHKTHKTRKKGVTLVEKKRLRLNHYRIQSKQNFRTKQTRYTGGDLRLKVKRYHLTWAYFREMDYNGVEDTALRDKQILRKRKAQ